MPKYVFSDNRSESESNSDSLPDKNEPEPIQYAPAGTICKIHNIYQTKPDRTGRVSWTKELPDYAVSPAEDPESRQYALIVRNAKCHDGSKSVEIHSIVVQSEPLKKFLANVLEGYRGVTVTLDRLTFKRPFEPFVHRWEQFTKARLNEELDATTKAHVDLLHKVLEEELGRLIAHKNDLVRNGVMTHDLLYTIFEPGDVIFGVVDSRQRAFVFKTSSIDCQTNSFQIASAYVDFDGDNIGFTEHASAIPPYEGTAPITSLPVFPLKYHSNSATVRKELVARGRIWEQHKGYHYKEYEGAATSYFEKKKVKVNVKGRIVIDTDAYNTFNPDSALSFSSKSLSDFMGIMQDSYGDQQILLPRFIRRKFNNSRLDEALSLPPRISYTLSDDQRLVSTPIVRGYSLNSKRWLEFYIDGVKDIVWNSRAFDSLVLPPAQQDIKRLILAFANARSKHLGDFDDVVQGKGRGIITLLSGPPGVGKTLTAESVAEALKVPLYVLSAGDLGTNAVGVEEKLKDVLSIVPKWGAVLLLDEADVFMETRNTADLARNELVSTFLRLLEYYEGIFFLTSNRAENIDPAFESRIHVSIWYPELDAASRRQIWAQFLGGEGLDAFSSADLDRLSKIPLNGRQIKNVVRTAYLLTGDKEEKLGYELIETVLRLRGFGV